VATHSPVLMAYPNARLLRLTKYGLEPVTVKETDHYKVMREFCDDPKGGRGGGDRGVNCRFATGRVFAILTSGRAILSQPASTRYVRIFRCRAGRVLQAMSKLPRYINSPSRCCRLNARRCCASLANLVGWLPGEYTTVD
jgi:hypothetical protein